MFCPKLENKIKEIYKDRDASHGFEHSLRVAKTSIRLARMEKSNIDQADLDLLYVAALVHDIEGFYFF